MHTYKFDDAAQAIFIEAHDKLCTCKMNIPDDEDRRGILSKAKLARMAMVVHALEQAIATPLPTSSVDEEDDNEHIMDSGAHTQCAASQLYSCC